MVACHSGGKLKFLFWLLESFYTFLNNADYILGISFDLINYPLQVSIAPFPLSTNLKLYSRGCPLKYPLYVYNSSKTEFIGHIYNTSDTKDKVGFTRSALSYYLLPEMEGITVRNYYISRVPLVINDSSPLTLIK